MGGDIQLIWGLNEFRAPDGCDKFKAHCIQIQDTVSGCVLSWNWPDGNRYLGGLRFGKKMPTRPRPRFWKHAFESLLDGVEFAWTCIGTENHRARRILESDVSWLPNYTKHQDITTWFVPLPHRRRNTSATAQSVETANWRHVAIASGKGLPYQIGRAMHQIGLPGIPPTLKALRLAYYQPEESVTAEAQKKLLKNLCGYDALIVVLPSNSERAKQWQAIVPRIHWKWSSALYTVSWRKRSAAPDIPNWKGLWL